MNQSHKFSLITIFNYIIALCLFVCAVVVLAVSTATTIYYDMHSDVDFPHYGRENIPLLIVLLALVLGIFVLMYRRMFLRKISSSYASDLRLYLRIA